MYYKVLPDTETFKRIRLVREKIKEANRHFKAIAREFGATGYSAGRGYAAGNPNGYPFETKPEGWVSVGGKYSGFYMPKAKHPDYERITSGPSVKYEEVNEAFGEFKKKVVLKNEGLMVLEGPIGISWDDQEVVFEIHDETDWNPSADVVEIKGSEWLEIKSRIHKRAES